MGNETGSEIGTLLRQWRNARGLTLPAAASRAGVATSTLSRWESGKRSPSIPELEATLAVLGVGGPERAAVLRLLDAPRALRHLRDADGSFVGLPVGGDLLRAMRVRRGLTQTQTARAAGATQGQVAKWETSEAWPDAERLHALCAVLGAQVEEVVALTTGRFRIPGESSAEQDPEVWMARANHALHRAPAAILDLTFLSLESRLWDLRGEAFALPMLGVAYAYHARSHLYLRHPERAEVWANRALAIAWQTKRLPEEWGAAVVAAGAAAAAGKRATDLNRAIHILKDWLPAIDHCRFRAWIMSDLATYRAELGEYDTAIRISLAAVHEVRSHPVETLYRRRDHARLLLQVGRHSEALAWIDATETTEPEEGDAFARYCLLKAECLQGLGSPSADTFLDQAHTRIENDRLDHLMPDWERLSGARNY